jgi:hypothetical protein
MSVRFWSKVNKDGPVLRPELGPCWEWTASLVTGGYGGFSVRRRQTRAHRYSWEETNGPVPSGLFVLHRCDNPPCVRPSHLFLGTIQDNVDDMMAKGRQVSVSRRIPHEMRTAMRYARAIAGATTDEIAAAVGIGYSQAQRILSGRVRPPGFTFRRFAVRPVTKVTDDQVREIRRLKAAGARVVDLVRQFGINPGHVWRLCTYRGRKDVLPAAETKGE